LGFRWKTPLLQRHPPPTTHQPSTTTTHAPTTRQTTEVGWMQEAGVQQKEMKYAHKFHIVFMIFFSRLFA